jgi:hypothetical protein
LWYVEDWNDEKEIWGDGLYLEAWGARTLQLLMRCQAAKLLECSELETEIHCGTEGRYFVSDYGLPYPLCPLLTLCRYPVPFNLLSFGYSILIVVFFRQ